MISKKDFGCYTGSPRHSNSKMKRACPSFSKIYARRYLTIGLVRGPDAHVDVDENSRWLNK